MNIKKFANPETSSIASPVNAAVENATTLGQDAIERLAAIVLGSDDAIISKNLDGIITSWNRGAEKIFGYKSVEAIGQSIDMLHPPGSLDEENTISKLILQGQRVTHFKTIRVCKDGRKITVSVTVSPIFDANGVVIGASKIARDISSEIEEEHALAIANLELNFQNHEKAKRAAELDLANIELAFQSNEKAKRAAELDVANKELAFQNNEKAKRVDELIIANEEKAKRVDELIIANEEKVKRADELDIANKELAYQSNEKAKRADELYIANKELAFQNNEKAKRVEELDLANIELAFQSDEKAKRAAELDVANKELAFQNNEKAKRVNELIVANEEKAKRVNELVIANEEKVKRADELDLANKELAYQSNEKAKRADELGIANTELAYQNNEKAKRAAELDVANKELAYQNDEKAKRVDELNIANKELAFQNNEKAKRADELDVANEELAYQNNEKANRVDELLIANEEKAKRAAELVLANEKLHSSLMETIELARQLIELRDPYTAGHEKHVGDLARAIGKEMGFDENRQEGLMIAGYLHDIGKIIVPVEILSKPGKISKEEYNMVKNHVLTGYELLKEVTFPWPIAQPVLEHHERQDGSGYPNGLKAGQISVEGSILAVADVVDAMSSHRPYRASLGIDRALAEIESGRGTLYDPAVADACKKVFKENHYTIEALFK